MLNFILIIRPNPQPLTPHAENKYCEGGSGLTSANPGVQECTCAEDDGCAATSPEKSDSADDCECDCKCGVDNTPCERGTCSNDKTKLIGYECACPPGYSGDNCQNSKCTEQPGPCKNDGECSIADDGTQECTCKGFWEGDTCTEVPEGYYYDNTKAVGPEECPGEFVVSFVFFFFYFPL